MSNACPRCDQPVYFSEKLSWGGRLWHQSCFKCTQCSKTIEQGKETDGGGRPFCTSCYGKVFGPKGFGYGGAVQGNYGPVEPARSSRRPSRQPQRAASHRVAPTPRRTVDRHASSSSDKCKRCGISVYFNEQIIWGGHKWHNSCFKCTQCAKTISRGHEMDHNGEPFCQSCHGKRFGPKGYGYGMGAGVMQGVYGDDEPEPPIPPPRDNTPHHGYRSSKSRPSTRTSHSKYESYRSSGASSRSRYTSGAPAGRESMSRSSVSSRSTAKHRPQKRSKAARKTAPVQEEAGGAFDFGAWVKWATDLCGCDKSNKTNKRRKVR